VTCISITLLPCSNELQLMGAVCCRAQACPDPLNLFPRSYLCLQPIDFDGEVTLFHFVLLRCVGKGAFGKVLAFFCFPAYPIFILPLKVRVVQHKQTRELYALKYINKSKCVKMKAVPNIIQERRLLEEVSPSPCRRWNLPYLTTTLSD
jgi:hypothetical protein